MCCDQPCELGAHSLVPPNINPPRSDVVTYNDISHFLCYENDRSLVPILSPSCPRPDLAIPVYAIVILLVPH